MPTSNSLLSVNPNFFIKKLFFTVANSFASDPETVSASAF